MRRAPSLLVLVLMPVLLAACQAGSDEPENSPPTLIASDPANGSTGAVEQIRLEFSEPIDQASLALTLCTHSGDETEPDCVDLSDDFLVWSEDSTVATWVSATPFAPATTYTLQIRAADVAGEFMQAQLDFTTAAAVDDTPPQVLTSTPSIDKITGILDLTLVFSEPMNRSSIELAFASDPLTPCTWTWRAGPESGQESGTCRTPALEQYTDYRFVITSGATDLAGNGLSAPFTLDVPVDNLAPRVLNISPPDGARFVGPKSPIVVHFNENAWVDGEWLVETSAGIVAGSATGTTTPTLRFTPDDSYGDGALVNWEIIDVGDDEEGSLISVSGSFTTMLVAAPPGGAGD